MIAKHKDTYMFRSILNLVGRRSAPVGTEPVPGRLQGHTPRVIAESLRTTEPITNASLKIRCDALFEKITSANTSLPGNDQTYFENLKLQIYNEQITNFLTTSGDLTVLENIANGVIQSLSDEHDRNQVSVTAVAAAALAPALPVDTITSENLLERIGILLLYQNSTAPTLYADLLDLQGLVEAELLPCDLINIDDKLKQLERIILP